MLSKQRVRVSDQADEVQRGAEEGVGGGDAEDCDAESAGRRQDGAHAAGEGHARHSGRAPVVSLTFGAKFKWPLTIKESQNEGGS